MLPSSYIGLDEGELRERISSAKKRLGKELVILGHHYQRDEVIEFADLRGDSFALSKAASEQKKAKYIVFCGVHFMAEAARILAGPKQHVLLPNALAGCPMSEMARAEDVENAWDELGAKGLDMDRVIPIVYMNSEARLKAFCGEHNGIVCTSSNAPRCFDWAFTRGDRIFFFPDEHLARNTARGKGIRKEDVEFWDSSRLTAHGSRVLLWHGFCHVHTFFTVEHINEARRKYPGCKIIVHPECPEAVVMAADESGSTEGICKFVSSQPKGTTVVIGTEINLVSRLARESGDVKVVPLARSLCPNMFKLSPADLCYTLESLVDGRLINEITLPDDIVRGARLALDRMLSV